MELQELIRYSEKIAGWRWTDPQIDWSGVKVLAGQRRVVLWLSCIIDGEAIIATAVSPFPAARP
jgi:hypothetical protein